MTGLHAKFHDATVHDGLGIVVTSDPRLPTVLVAATASRCYYTRVTEGRGPITAILVPIGTASGNVSVGVYSSSGVGRSAIPAAAKAVTASTALASPTNGMTSVALGRTVHVQPGDWLAVAFDGTPTFRGTQLTLGTSDIALGFGMIQASTFPLPSTPSSLSGYAAMPVLLAA